jgi:hypothetical protein
MRVANDIPLGCSLAYRLTLNLRPNTEGEGVLASDGTIYYDNDADGKAGIKMEALMHSGTLARSSSHAPWILPPNTLNLGMVKMERL